MAATMEGIMRTIFACVPTAPFAAADASSLSAAFSSSTPAGGGEDRISRLPDALPSDIVSCLPVKDAARTAALSPRWRRLRASTPLVLDDNDVFTGPGDGCFGTFDWRVLAATVSCVLASHPGPIRRVHLDKQ